MPTINDQNSYHCIMIYNVLTCLLVIQLLRLLIHFLCYKLWMLTLEFTNVYFDLTGSLCMHETWKLGILKKNEGNLNVFNAEISQVYYRKGIMKNLMQ